MNSNWSLVPFHFWTGTFFLLGAMVGSFLNVCIYRMPRGESLVRPGSHCPHCQWAIPLRLNIPLVSWVWLGGRCRNCGEPIAVRYVAVEFLTALLFTGCWLTHGRVSPALALVFGVFVAGLVAAAFIDLEHFIIPDAITLGGLGLGLAVSFLLPVLHGVTSSAEGLKRGAVGAMVGWGVVWGIVLLGKLMLGRQRFVVEGDQRVYFLEEKLVLPDREIPYAEVFYRKWDAIVLRARRVEMADRCYRDVEVRLTQQKLRVGADEYATEAVPGFVAVTEAVVVPREAMGMGDVKFMAGIGAFLGWPGVVFSLTASALVGSVVGVTLMLLGRHERSNPMQYGPYIALAAAVWVYAGDVLLGLWLGR